MLRRLSGLGALVLVVTMIAGPTFADTNAAKPAAELAAHFPSPRSVEQEVTLDGRKLNYVLTVGVLPVSRQAGQGDQNSQNSKIDGGVVVTSYVVPSKMRRPVTFLFNGGPGSGSGFLNVGAVGPKRVPFGSQDDSPSAPMIAIDNPNTWLDFTDLVFIDPVGTGYSRSFLNEADSEKAFYGIQQDAKYLARLVYDWLAQNGRMSSDKYLAGESYGGFRVPRIANELLTTGGGGVGIRGLVLISPYLDGNLLSPTGNSTFGVSPMSEIVQLPSMAAANYYAQGLTASPAQMQAVESFARDEFSAAWFKGFSDPKALAAFEKRLAEFTGLSQDAVARVGGRIDQSYFLKERFRADAVVGSRYDINVTRPDPHPWSNSMPVDSVVTTFTTVSVAMTDLITNVAGWKAEGPYYAYNPAVSRRWYQQGVDPEAVSALRSAMALDPRMKVLIAHGDADLSCPYFASQLVIDQMPPKLRGDRITLKRYPGGHMFYSRPGSGASFKADARAIFE